MSQATQADCVRALAVDLAVSEDTAVDLLNGHESAQEVFDALGTEVVGNTPSIPCTDARECYQYQYSHEDLVGIYDPPPAWVFNSVFIVFMLVLCVAIYLVGQVTL